MPFEISFDILPIGHATAAVKGPGMIPVQSVDFISSEDGQEFIRRLEGLPTEILKRLSPQSFIVPSQVDHLLAVIRRDRTATVYVNELPLTFLTRVSRPVQMGELIAKNDIVDITEMQFGDIIVPQDAGIALVFSVGWRKGFFYDLTPLRPDAPLRTVDLRCVFGQLLSHVLFQERFSILESEWEAFFKVKWFPFIGLRNETIDQLLKHLRAGWDLDELTGRIVDEFKQQVPSFLDLWKRQPAFTNHVAILERAVERFSAGDYTSCTGLVFPRIEGIMRSNHAMTSGGATPSQANLCTSAVRANINRSRCLLLPHVFERYLKEVYFASFDPNETDIDLSRNSVGHGVASAAAFSEKGAVIGLLVVHQLCYCFEPPL